MKHLIPFTLICSLVFISCGERAVGTSNVPAEAPVTPYVTPSKSATPSLSPVANPAQTATNVAAATARLNPAHGQPGHRCDIAVGAALPADNAATAPAAGISPLVAPAPSLSPAPASTAGLNPAHGQPGHRCDIPVGSPLNSKPAAK